MAEHTLEAFPKTHPGRAEQSIGLSITANVPSLVYTYQYIIKMASNMVARSLIRVSKELGLMTLYQSTRDVKLLCFQRFIRLFAFSGTTLILTLFLADLGISDTKIGLFMTLTLLGDILLSVLLTFTADRLGRRNVLCLGALALTVSGVVFGLSDDFWVLLAAATIGVISPRYGPTKGAGKETRV